MTSAPAHQSDLPTAALDSELPVELIATCPAEPRDSARMLVVRRESGVLEHRSVRDLPEYFRRGDALVFNVTSVLPARLVGRKLPGGGRVEGLYLSEPVPGHWEAMLSANKRLRRRDRVELLDGGDHPSGTVLELIEPLEDGWLVALPAATAPAPELLARVGRTPLPPYIRRARRGGTPPDDLDRNWYQTVYADPAARRSVAAPTAGLHFTPDLLQALERTGVVRLALTLDVGPGTFRPITASTVAGHVMHEESYSVSRQTLDALRATRAAGGRVVAVGTTTVRTLESLPDPLPAGPVSGRTGLLIAPPFRLRYVHSLLTNFHLPRSTLLALVAAVLGLEQAQAVYREAVARRYRFYSYGDAMLIL